MDPWTVPTLRTGRLTLTTSLAMRTQGVNDLFVNPSQNRLRGEVAPSASSGVAILQLNTANGELFALYPTNYPSVLQGRVPEAEWKKVVDKINELWSVLVTAHKKLYAGNLLSYTVFAVPVHLHKNHKFRALETQVLQEMGTYLDQENIKIADKGVAILFFKEEAEGDLPTSYFIEIRRE